MKAYTDLEQSKKLEEILPLESADMIYMPVIDINSMSNSGFFDIPECYPFNEFKDSNNKPLPCWSLTALLGVLPKQIGRHTKTLYWFDDAWHCEYVDEDSEGKYGVTADNPVDACVKMIIKLHEKNLL